MAGSKKAARPRTHGRRRLNPCSCVWPDSVLIAKRCMPSSVARSAPPTASRTFRAGCPWRNAATSAGRRRFPHRLLRAAGRRDGLPVARSAWLRLPPAGSCGTRARPRAAARRTGERRRRKNHPEPCLAEYTELVAPSLNWDSSPSGCGAAGGLRRNAPPTGRPMEMKTEA